MTTLGPFLKFFQGDSAGGDELLILPNECIGALAILSWGSDYGSGMSAYELTEDQLQLILSDTPPFTDSYEARSWLLNNATYFKEVA